jgi:hypothetical protein
VIAELARNLKWNEGANSPGGLLGAHASADSLSAGSNLAGVASIGSSVTFVPLVRRGECDLGRRSRVTSPTTLTWSLALRLLVQGPHSQCPEHGYRAAARRCASRVDSS